jgi:lipopolysaccharide heptosyltransferase II
VKILIVRFSSIGDIVLTTPIIRCLKHQLPNVTIHYLVKEKYKHVLDQNPNINKIYSIHKKLSEVKNDLKKENYDHIIDLHHNLRTLLLKLFLAKSSHSFEKLNVKKWLFVKFKINRLPKIHIVERYFKTIAFLNVKNDNLPCDYFISKSDFYEVKARHHVEKYLALAIGAQFATKRLPLEKIIEIIEKIDVPILILGDNNDKTIANQIVKHFEFQKNNSQKNIVNLCGELSLTQSASVVKQAQVLLTHDTGLMHIASAFRQNIISVWGNTTPDFGMYPYFPEQNKPFSIHEVFGLNCRPCSKIGFQKCPKKHFSCMNLQDTIEISEEIKKIFR